MTTERNGPAAATILDSLSGTRDALSVRRVFGDPYEIDGMTIIPVARISGVAVTGDEERSRRVQQQPIGGAAEVQRLQQTGATRPDHEQVALARQGNARVGFGGEVGDLGEPGFGEHGARLRRLPAVQLGDFMGQRHARYVGHVRGDHFQAPARPAVRVDEQPRDVGSR